MTGYGQFCPLARATEVLGERWTPLIIRELLSGNTRFNDIKRGVPRISPSLLTKRLRTLEEAGVVERTPGDAQGGQSYRLTRRGEELGPIVRMMGEWGARWYRQPLRADDLDPGLLLWDIRRSFDRELPDSGREMVIEFVFTDAGRRDRHWWLTVAGDDVQVRAINPEQHVDLFVEAELRALTEVWIGAQDLSDVQADRRIVLRGDPDLIGRFPELMKANPLAAARRGLERGLAIADE